MIKNSNNKEEMIIKMEDVNYCLYCKEIIKPGETQVHETLSDSEAVYHTSCWKYKRNNIEELNFEV